MTVTQSYITDLVKIRPVDEEALRQAKRDLATKHGTTIVSNAKILKGYRAQVATADQDQALLRVLRKRDVRTLSGIAPVTVLTKPYPCPGRCAYCPTEARMPKSYIASEPAAQRALQLHFDPYQQMKLRIEAFEANGHSADKIELIVLGGTWSYYDETYQEKFIKGLYDGANEFIADSLTAAQKHNETAQHRIIGLTLETRPDYVTKEELWRMRQFGCTHVQIGVQTLDQQVLDLIKRDDNVQNIARATAMLRDFGFKVTYHLMPGLPGATPDGDYNVFKQVFTDPRFQPDMLKIYPCVVVKSAQIYQWYKDGKYKPYEGKQLLDLLVRIKKDLIPPYVRINRLIRDIPGDDIVAGNLVTNLRQLMHDKGVACRCIRCREVRDAVPETEVQLVERTYRAGQGTEHFLSFENVDRSKLYAFTRLRLPDRENRITEQLEVVRFFDKKKITMTGNELAFPTDTALIRELHTYGELIPVGSERSATQHIGFGKRLMARAEEIARREGYKKLAVISGIGVRGYYEKLGFTLQDTYMVKNI